jgi:transposase
MQIERRTACAYVGIDIAAKTATIACYVGGTLTRPPFTIDQTPAGFTTLLQHLAQVGLPPTAFAIVMEHTSTYWMPLAIVLVEAGYPVSVVNPVQTHNFAKSLLRRAKTDPLDAMVLAAYAAERRLRWWTPPPALYFELRARLLVRQQLLELRTQLTNHDDALRHWPVAIDTVREPLQDLADQLVAQRQTFERELQSLLATGAWATNAELLRSIPGLGTMTIAWLLVATQNFQLCTTAEELVAYAGLAPLPFESGSSIRRRRRIGHAGNAYLRKALYLATLSAAQNNPTIKAFYTRLKAAGKPMKVARCAAARKLLVLAWAVVKKQQPFRQQPDGLSAPV